MDGTDNNPFDTDDAFTEGYDNLEQRCFEEDVDYDEATSTGIRLRDWQVLAINTVKNRSGSNQTQVLYSAYLEGLSVVRDVVERDRIKDLGEVNDMLVEVSTNYQNYSNEEDELYSNALRSDIGDPFRHHGNCDERFTFVCRNSAKSEVKDTFEADAKFEPWIHRSIISLGLDSSDSIGSTLKDKVQEVKRGVSGMYEKSRLRAEESLKYIITENHSFWKDNGIKQGQLQDLKDCVEMMETKHQEPCRFILRDVEQNAEIIEG